ncbi:MAG: tetratricopeptide repeat protein [Bacillaceae bacterium]
MSKKNTSFFLILGITVVVFFYTWAVGEKNKEVYSQNNNRYSDAAVKVETHPQEAINLLTKLEKSTPTNYLYNFKKGIAYNNLGNYKKASKEFKKALHIRPLLVTDAAFVLQYAKSSIYVKDTGLAKELLQVASKLELNDDLKQTYEELKQLEESA